MIQWKSEEKRPVKGNSNYKGPETGKCVPTWSSMRDKKSREEVIRGINH